MEWSGRRVLLVCSVAMLISAAVAVAVMNRRSDDIVLRFEPLADDTTVTVYVGGAVKHPGLYTLPSGSRLATAIERAEALEDSDFSGLRMADSVQDKMTVFVPHRLARATATGTNQPDNATAHSQSPGPTSTTTAATPALSAHQLININTASLAELELLPGIGPALAQRILDYRLEHGPFASPDDLDDVKGISARMVDVFRSRITTSGEP